MRHRGSKNVPSTGQSNLNLAISISIGIYKYSRFLMIVIPSIKPLPTPFLHLTMSTLLFSKAKYLSTIIHLIILSHGSSASKPVDPTQGFMSLPLNRSYYHIQKPYDVPEDRRYSFCDGIHKCWVYSTDKPHTRTSRTKPRTEIAIQVTQQKGETSLL